MVEQSTNKDVAAFQKEEMAKIYELKRQEQLKKFKEEKDSMQNIAK